MNKKGFQYFLMIICCVLLTTILIPTKAIAQREGYKDQREGYKNDDRNYRQRYTKREVADIINRIEEASGHLRKDLSNELDKSVLEGSKKEDKINEDAKNFEKAFEHLRDEFDRNDNWWESKNKVETALESAKPIATRLRNNRFSSDVETQWEKLCADLNKLASAYNIPTTNYKYKEDDRSYEQRYSKNEVAEIIKRVEESSSRFRKDLDRDLDKSRLDGSKEEDRLNEDVKNFEKAFERLRNDFDRNDKWWESRNNVETALDSARSLSIRLSNNNFSPNVQAQWRDLCTDLNKLASTYNLPPI